MFFLPAVGRRAATDGLLGHHGAAGRYWSFSQIDVSHGDILLFNAAGSLPGGAGIPAKAEGYSIRCVRSKSILFSCLLACLFVFAQLPSNLLLIS